MKPASCDLISGTLPQVFRLIESSPMSVVSKILADLSYRDVGRTGATQTLPNDEKQALAFIALSLLNQLVDAEEVVLPSTAAYGATRAYLTTRFGKHTAIERMFGSQADQGR